MFNFPAEPAWKFLCSWQVTIPLATVVPLSIWVLSDAASLADTIKSVAASYWGGAFWISSTIFLFTLLVILRDQYKGILRERDNCIKERDDAISALNKEIESLKGGGNHG